jgi:hypothetical protein
MDAALLATKGVIPGNAATGHVDGFALHIGARATLLRSAGARAYGIVMTVDPREAKALYAESSVADYVPEPVVVELSDGSNVEAACYNLPANKITGTNKDYAKSLAKLATRLGFPDAYIDQIRQASS